MASLRVSRAASSVLDRPRPRRVRTSSSRGVQGGEVGVRGGRVSGFRGEAFHQPSGDGGGQQGVTGVDQPYGGQSRAAPPSQPSARHSAPGSTRPTGFWSRPVRGRAWPPGTTTATPTASKSCSPRCTGSVRARAVSGAGALSASSPRRSRRRSPRAPPTTPRHGSSTPGSPPARPSRRAGSTASAAPPPSPPATPPARSPTSSGPCRDDAAHPLRRLVRARRPAFGVALATYRAPRILDEPVDRTAPAAEPPPGDWTQRTRGAEPVRHRSGTNRPGGLTSGRALPCAGRA